MRLLLDKMSKHMPHINEHQYGLDDALAIAARHRINVAFLPYPDGVDGYYTENRQFTPPRRSIVLNSKLSETRQTLTLLHELTHYFLHATMWTGHCFWSKANPEEGDELQELEAEAISLIAYVPLHMLEEEDHLEFARDHADFARLLEKRKRVYETYGI